MTASSPRARRLLFEERAGPQQLQHSVRQLERRRSRPLNERLDIDSLGIEGVLGPSYY